MGQCPLFWSKIGSPISYVCFPNVISLLTKLLLVQGKLTPHSFRIGAASWAASNGASNDDTKRMGRWVSDAFLVYIRVPSLQLKL